MDEADRLEVREKDLDLFKQRRELASVRLACDDGEVDCRPTTGALMGCSTACRGFQRPFLSVVEEWTATLRRRDETYTWLEGPSP
eukprot:3907766-Lingulodinium_polyedra.AAC.1